MLPKKRTFTEDIDTWQVVIISDPKQPLPRDAQILRLIDPARRVEYILGQPQVTLGQSPCCDLRLEWERLGELHCRLEWKQGCWWVIDLESADGFFVNGTRYRESELLPGDTLTMSDRTLDVDQIAVAELV
ncbi:FHA domain-containing protein [Telmatocola sphagniphila]|uniref:FHA domain-containing protein n=1 Tax=Telmatocola sphagniphila TaxID=1123043 RepID=A0A8E6B616_9BACT|nr:FHA domain-containing protein [Telmatocola sphagniphila]QVL32027.1 FHA domain-containing protein [Telmatocola sphagniphila]